MKTKDLDALRTQLINTILHGADLLEDLQTINDNFCTLLPTLGNLSESERATQVAVLCDFNPELSTYLQQLTESLAGVLARLTTADDGEAWLRRQVDILPTLGESSAA
jgi:uncharacterized phage infection (PIP) family protein YhgE